MKSKNIIVATGGTLLIAVTVVLTAAKICVWCLAKNVMPPLKP